MSVMNSNVSKALEALVHKRQQQLAYLRRTHQPDVDFQDKDKYGQSSYWLNTISVEPSTINKEMQNEIRKINGWFCLGTSLSKLLEIEDHTVMINSFIQLMEEYSYQFGARIHAGFSYLRSKNLQDKFDLNSNQSIKPIIWKRDNKVVFQLLQSPKLVCLFVTFEMPIHISVFVNITARGTQLLFDCIFDGVYFVFALFKVLASNVFE